MRGMRASNSGYEGIKCGVRGCQMRGARVSNAGYEGIKYGVRGYQMRGARVSNSGYEGIKCGVQGYQIHVPEVYITTAMSVGAGETGTAGVVCPNASTA